MRKTFPKTVNANVCMLSTQMSHEFILLRLEAFDLQLFRFVCMSWETILDICSCKKYTERSHVVGLFIDASRDLKFILMCCQTHFDREFQICEYKFINKLQRHHQHNRK